MVGLAAGVEAAVGVDMDSRCVVGLLLPQGDQWRHGKKMYVKGKGCNFGDCGFSLPRCENGEDVRTTQQRSQHLLLFPPQPRARSHYFNQEFIQRLFSSTMMNLLLE